MAGTVRIAILANAAQAKKEIGSVTRDLDGFSKKGSRWGDTMKGVLGANIVTKGADLIVGAAGKVAGAYDQATESASRLQQAQGAAQATFGKGYAQVAKDAEAAAQKQGLSNAEYLEFQSIVGTGLKNQGIKDYQKQAAKLTQNGADLAAQWGGSTKDAMEAQSAFLRGETDPMEKYGVAIKQSDINARLAAKGQDKLTGSSRKQAEQQARLDLLYKQTATSQGAFNRESGTYANLAQKNAAATENLKAKFGTIFLPIMTKVQGVIANQVLPAIERMIPVIESVMGKIGPAVQGLLPVIQGIIGQIGPVIATVRTAIMPVVTQIQALFAAFQNAGAAGAGLAVFESLKSVLLTVAPIIGQVVGTILNTFRQLAPTIVSIVPIVAQNIRMIADIIKSVWGAIGPYVLPLITTVFTTVVNVIKGAVTVIGGVLKVVSSILKGDWAGAWQGAKQIVSGQTGIIKAIVSGLFNVIKTVLTAIYNLNRTIFNGITNVIRSAGAAIASTVSSKFNQARAAVQSAWNAVRSVTISAWNSIKSAVTSGVSNVIAKIRELPGKAKSALGSIGSALYSAGQNLVRGLMNGISAMAGAVASKARSVVQGAINAAKNALGIASPSKVFKKIGKFVGQGFIQGLAGTESQVASSVKKMVGYLEKEAKAKGAAGKRAKAALKIVNRLDNTAVAIAKKKTVATAKLTAAQDKLNELVKQRNDFVTGVRDNAKAYASILTMGMADNAPQTTQNILTQMQERLKAITNFRDKLAALKARGLNATTIEQIVAGGVEGGTETLETLFSADSSVLKQINTLQGTINTAADGLGNVAGDALYGAGVQAQAGLVAGLLSNQKALQAAADKIAKTLSDAVKKALKIKSPSRVFQEIGGYVTEGLSIGLDDKATKRAGAVLAGSLVSGFGSPQLMAQAGSWGSSGGVQQNITVEVRADATTNLEELGRTLTKALKAYKDAGGKLVAA